MLDDLEKIRWSELKDCYGLATSIPQLIRDLTCKDLETQSKTLDELGNRICHQASTYQATIPAVPFLLELACSPSVLNRARILSLLQTIAIGLDFDMLYYQARVESWLAEMEAQVGEMTEQKRRELNWGPVIGLACYAAIRKGVPSFLNMLNDRDRNVRMHAAYNLAWLPADHRRSIPRLRERMQSVSKADELATLIFSVGLLEYQSNVAKPSRSFVRPFLSDRRDLIRYTAAMYLYWHEPNTDVINILKELSTNEDYDNSVGSKSLFFAGYAWNQYAARLLELHNEKNNG